MVWGDVRWGYVGWYWGVDWERVGGYGFGCGDEFGGVFCGGVCWVGEDKGVDECGDC